MELGREQLIASDSFFPGKNMQRLHLDLSCGIQLEGNTAAWLPLFLSSEGSGDSLSI